MNRLLTERELPEREQTTPERLQPEGVDPMNDDPVTLGELSRRIDSMERRFEAEFQSLGQRFEKEFSKVGHSIDSLQFVHLDQYRAERDADRRRIIELEETHKWIVRAIVVSIVFPLIVAIIGVAILGGIGS